MAAQNDGRQSQQSSKDLEALQRQRNEEFQSIARR